MRYLALGDSISIDDYTGVAGGGAASQLARRLGAELIDLTRDGEVTDGVLRDLADRGADVEADVATVTAGGNDLLMGRPASAIVGNLDAIAARLSRLDATVIVNTVYDPTDGDDARGQELLGLPPETRPRSTPSTTPSSGSRTSRDFSSRISSGCSTGTASRRATAGRSA